MLPMGLKKREESHMYNNLTIYAENNINRCQCYLLITFSFVSVQ